MDSIDIQMKVELVAGHLEIKGLFRDGSPITDDCGCHGNQECITLQTLNYNNISLTFLKDTTLFVSFETETNKVSLKPADWWSTLTWVGEKTREHSSVWPAWISTPFRPGSVLCCW